MSKTKTFYTCQQCGAHFPKWVGQCNDCGQWNTLVEETIQANPKNTHYAGAETASIHYFSEVQLQQEIRFSTGFKEFDRVLGGGLVKGSVVLLGGDPGIGKSTILLQTVCELGKHQKVLYITGEESLQQLTARANRLEIHADYLGLLAETQIEKILTLITEFKPDVVIIDSIQTMFSDQGNSAPGSVSQVRESAAQLVRFAKQTQTALFLVGHVTKEGQLAGPRVLEHMVDTVLYFEGESDSRYRMIRAI
jgi:DNA repair protein RadA/Sms